jgi:hypothetical protein
MLVGMDAAMSMEGTRSQRAWAAVDWTGEVPQAELIAADHYAVDGLASLDPAVRIRFSHLATCHTCELFIHFERYLIAYVERHAHALPGGARRWRWFIDEERRHAAAFGRLLTRIRPGLYPAGEPRFMRWTRTDDALVAATRPVPFFLLAALFEEITLWMPRLMAEAPVHDPTLLEVMALHADEERRHIALDQWVLREARDHMSPWRLRVDVWSTLPLLLHCDRRARAGWRRMIDQLAAETGIDADVFEARGASLSDRRGMASFAAQLRTLELPGGAGLASLLERVAAR